VAYLIDCDAIAHCETRPDCGHVLGKLVSAIERGVLKTVEQVFDELRRWPDIQGLFRPVKKKFLIDPQYTTEISTLAGQIAEDFPFLFDQSGNRNPDPADPWLIAASKSLGWTLVTDERPASTKKIPYVCRQQSVLVRCINGPNFFQEINIA
jgi:Domain of unknown function (DUF4411)